MRNILVRSEKRIVGSVFGNLGFISFFVIKINLEYFWC